MKNVLKITVGGLLSVALLTQPAYADPRWDRGHGHDRWEHGHHSSSRVVIYSGSSYYAQPYYQPTYYPQQYYAAPSSGYSTRVVCNNSYNPLGALVGGIAGGVLGSTIGK